MSTLNKKVCVTIPVYKNLDKLSADELASLTQCFKILGKNYSICLVCPPNVAIKDYRIFTASLANSPVLIENFEESYFGSIEGYNALMMGVELYDRFKEFEYILIYQLDCWVFRDELQDWCEKGYDYIGAPLFNNYGTFNEKTEITVIGNGGLSLRKVSKFIEVLTWKKTVKGFTSLLAEFNANRSVGNFVLLILKWAGYHNTVPYILNFYKRYKINEDLFFSYHFTEGYNICIKVPPIETGIKFSFDRFPQYIYKLNNNRLPFGCHGWSRGDGVYYAEDKNFWNKLIIT